MTDPRENTNQNLDSLIRRAALQQANLHLENQFQRNMAYFAIQHPEIHAHFCDYHPQELGLQFTDEGYVNLVNLELDNKPVYPEEPRRYTEKYIEQYIKEPTHYRITAAQKSILGGENDAHVTTISPLIDLILNSEQIVMGRGLEPDTQFMIMLGIGLGYQIESLLSATDIHHLVIIEPHEDIFYASLHTLNWESVFAHFARPSHSLKYIVGQSESNCFNTLREHIARIGIHNVIKPFIFDHLTSDKIKKSSRAFFDRLPSMVTTMGYFDDERISLSHTVANYRKGIAPLRAHPLIDQKFNNTPVFLIANGPSLDKAVDFLQKQQPNAIVISCGTALGSLYKMGIKPDFHVEMERTRPVVEWIESGTDADFRKDISLLALNTVHPDVFDLFENKGLGMKNNDLGSHFITQILGKDQYLINLTQCNPTVLNAGLAFTIALGFKNIYLVGADLGFSEGAQHHSSLSSHYDVEDEHVKDLNLYNPLAKGNKTVAGNFGGKVSTTIVYLTAKMSIETLLKANKRVQCFNTSAGIAIEGVAACHLHDIKLSQSGFNKLELSNQLFKEHFYQTGLKKLGSDKKILKSFEYAITLCDAFKKLFDVTIQSRNEGIALLDKQHGIAIETGLNTKTQYCYTLLKGSVSSFNLSLAKCLYNCATEEDCVALFNQAKQYYQQFLTLAQQKIKTDLLSIDSRTRDLSSKMKKPQ